MWSDQPPANQLQAAWPNSLTTPGGLPLLMLSQMTTRNARRSHVQSTTHDEVKHFLMLSSNGLRQGYRHTIVQAEKAAIQSSFGMTTE